jgi:Domain of unknown function (DUF4249)
MKNTLSIFILLAFFFTACEKEIEFDGDVKTPKLVLNGMLIADTTLTVHISNSLSVIDNGNHQNITDAVVVLLQNESIIDTLHHTGDGYYKSDVIIMSNTLYKIRAKAPNFKSIEASDIVPSPITVDSITRKIINGQYDEEMHFNIYINDKEAEKNYYIIRLYKKYLYFGNNDWQQYGLDCSDPYIEDVGYGDNYYEDIFLPDNMFNGNQHNLEISTYWYDADSVDYKIEVYSSSEAYYNYSKSITRYRMASGNPFSQPVQVYSNINNGFGIFAGGNLYKKIIPYQ